ncbi:hypothetical protein D3C72_1685980 [compost metagenome]
MGKASDSITLAQSRRTSSSTPAPGENPSRIRTNSSPPILATVSAERSICLSRLAVNFNTWSPTAWPLRSLIVLKSLRSINARATRVLLLRAFSRASARRCSNARRLGRPVKASLCARFCSWLAQAFSSVISRTTPIIFTALP